MHASGVQRSSAGCAAAHPARSPVAPMETRSVISGVVMAVRLFVGNLAFDVTEAELREHFAAVGRPLSIYLPMDRDTGKPRGFAFIEFSERAEAEEAMRRLNQQMFKGRPLAVNEARARDDHATAGPPRTAAPRPSVSSDTRAGDTRAGDGRNFGPDAAPRRRRRPLKSAAPAERRLKRPIYKRAAGPVRFGAADDDGDDEDGRDEHVGSRQDDVVDHDTA